MDDDLLRLATVAVAEDGTASPAVRLVAHGEIDLGTAPRLAGAFDALIDGGATLVILDASGVEFLDSSGLRTIVNAGNRLSAQGGQLVIEGVSGAVHRVLEVSGLIEHYRR